MGAARPFQGNPTLAVEALTLARGGRTLFEGLSFVAGPGGYVEIKGANGSGKTSLLRAVAGFLPARAGRVRFSAEEPATALHYIGHRDGLKPTASVRAHLGYWAGLLGGTPSVGFVAQTLGLERVLDLPARVLSQGQARRLALSRLIIALRPLWLLDEPAAALDSEGRAVLAALIEAQRAQGGVVLAAVHEPLGPAPSETLVLA